MTGPRRAVFLDRDGTIIEDTAFVGRPDLVSLIPGAAVAIRRLNDHGIPVVIVTNQSGIARGLLSMREYEAVEQRMADDLLAAAGARVLASYMCPHHPDFGGPCECRKPGVFLYRRAAAEHRLNLARSFFAGDRWRDVAPALAFGGRGVLVPSPVTPDEDRELAQRNARVAASLGDVVDTVLAAGEGPA